MPAFKALPDPLPVPPEVPVSYLGSISQRVESNGALSYEQQSALLLDIKKCVRDADLSPLDVTVLLSGFRKRRDTLLSTAEEIDILLEKVASSERKAKEEADRKAKEEADRKAGQGVLAAEMIVEKQLLAKNESNQSSTVSSSGKENNQDDGSSSNRKKVIFFSIWIVFFIVTFIWVYSSDGDFTHSLIGSFSVSLFPAFLTYLFMGGLDDG